MREVGELLRTIQDSVQGLPRPEHFTDYNHCSECAEHDETLRAHTPETIGVEELGNAGWDPICFITDQGFLYYLPAMARLALGAGDVYYLDQFLFHLPGRIGAMSPAQRKAVHELLEYLFETRFDEIGRYGDLENLIIVSERLRPPPPA